MRSFLNKMISTGFYIGYCPKAPGTFGSILGLGLSYALIKLISYYNPDTISSYLIFLIIWTLYLVISFLSVRFVEKHNIFVHDDPRIVIDEILAQGYVLIFSLMINKNLSDIYSILSSFIWFRVFDILKPSLIGRIDKNMKNYIGTMLDDLVSSVFSIVVIYIIHLMIS